MNDEQVRTLLDEATAGPRPPSTVDVGRAVRQANRTRRRRVQVAVAGIASVSVAAAVAVPAVLARLAVPSTSDGQTGQPVASGPVDPSTGPATAGPPPLPRVAPTRFDPLVRTVQVGWLPTTLLDGQWELTATGQQFGGFEPGQDKGLLVNVLARGQRFGTGGGLGLPMEPRETPTDAVRGRPAVCIGEASVPGSCSALRWEYAPGAFARVSYAGSLGPNTAATGRLLRRVAESVSLSAAERVRLPFSMDLSGTRLRPVRTLVDVRTRGTGQFGERWSAGVDLSTDPDAWDHSARNGFHGVTISALSVPGPIYRDDPPNTQFDGRPATAHQDAGGDSIVVYGLAGSRVSVDRLQADGPENAVSVAHRLHMVAKPADRGSWTDHPFN